MTTAAGTDLADRLRVVPVLHGRFEFAVAVRRAFREHAPTDVVVELPAVLGPALSDAVRRLPRLSVLRLIPERGRSRPLFFLVEPTDAFVEAARLALGAGLPLTCADRDALAVTPVRQAFPDPHAIEALGVETYTDACLAAQNARAPAPEDAVRERTMAWHLTRLLADPSRRILFVCGLTHARPVLARVGLETAVPFGRPARGRVELFHLHPDAAREVLSEIPFLAAAWERWRQSAAAADEAAGDTEAVPAAAPDWPLPRAGVHRDLIDEARRRHAAEEGERIAPPSVANLMRWARNIALLEGALAPDFHTLVLAARGVGGDDFAWHLWDAGSAWPWSEAGDGRPELRVTLEDLERTGRVVRFDRTLRRRRSALRLVRQRRREPRPGEWRENWSGDSVCSHPPEDVVIEGFGRFLAHRAKGILAADRSRVEPFTASLLDGIDFRETIRNRAHDRRLWVRSVVPVRGDVGSVIVAFDPEDAGHRFRYRMTWQGEHDQESDMALYSTPPGERLAGPGISRCEYGGFLLTWPPGRMFSVWEDPEFLALAHSPGEHLLLAGLDYALERLVVYVAPRPPRSFCRAYATRRRRRLLYVPIGQLSPLTLRRLRIFHVLDGRNVRAWARDFIG